MFERFHLSRTHCRTVTYEIISTLLNVLDKMIYYINISKVCFVVYEYIVKLLNSDENKAKIE